MDKFSFLNAVHSGFIADLYDQYLVNPDTVEASWRSFFQGYDLANENYSIDGEEIPIIDLLPALPDVWDKGEINGLRAANGFEVDIEWNEGTLVQARIQSLFGYKVVLRYKGKDIPLDLQKGEEFIHKI